jgi:Ca2+-binding RTX toxin-like protein
LSDDVLFGNSADNLFFEMGGNDVIDGRGGVNTVVFTANRSAYNIGKSEVANHWLVEGVNGSLGSDDLINVTRLQFADTKVRLDVDGNPTMAAKLIGVVLGGDWVKSTVIAGIALGALESGFQPLTLARLGLESGMFLSLAGSAGNADFYNTVYKNVYGSKPDLVTLQNAVTQLDSGKLTQSDMVLQMIDLAPNLQNIDLVGIQLHGFDYV